jgi:uncharacterized protein (DUF1684 family)
MLRLVKRAAAILILLIACREEPRDLTYSEEIRGWQTNRATRLKAEDGWLSLVGLHWLREGTNTIEDLGTFTLSNGKVTLGPSDLRTDADENGPTVVTRGSTRFYAIKRSDRYGIRVKDANAETRVHFRGLDYYPIDPKWRVAARFEKYNPPKKIPITDITGTTSDQPVPGALVFTVDGREYRLDPILEGEEDLFIIFKDETSRDTTYPAGRYLYAKLPGPDGRVIVDFNKAYNPPCAFTPYATCPLPPQQNRMTLRVEAGEQRYKGEHS